MNGGVIISMMLVYPVSAVRRQEYCVVADQMVDMDLDEGYEDEYSRVGVGDPEEPRSGLLFGILGSDLHEGWHKGGWGVLLVPSGRRHLFGRRGRRQWRPLYRRIGMGFMVHDKRLPDKPLKRVAVE